MYLLMNGYYYCLKAPVFYINTWILFNFYIYCVQSINQSQFTNWLCVNFSNFAIKIYSYNSLKKYIVNWNLLCNHLQWIWLFWSFILIFVIFVLFFSVWCKLYDVLKVIALRYSFTQCDCNLFLLYKCVTTIFIEKPSLLPKMSLSALFGK